MPIDGTFRAYDALVDHLGPLARYRLDEPTGTLARDDASGLDGTYRNGAALGQVGIVGSNAAASFDGINDFVEVATASGDGGSGPAKIVVFGDSLVEGFLLSRDEAFPARLEAALDARGLDTEVVNAGLSGERTGESVDRIGGVLAQHADADAVIIVLGTNDALNNGAEPATTPAAVKANLASIITEIQAAGMEVLLVGVRGQFDESDGDTVGYSNPADRAAFEANYVELAQEFGVQLYLDYFDGMTHDNGRLRPEGFHPTAAGVEHLVSQIDDQAIDVLRDAGAIGPTDDPLLLADGTVEVWFNADTVDGTRGLVSKDAAGFGTGGHLSVWLQNGEVVASLQDTAGQHVVRSGATRIQAGRDAHVALTFGAAGMHLYVDGVEVDADGYTGGTGATSGGRGNFEPLVIGALNSASASGTTDGAAGFFDGRIDEANIYGRALTAAEVAELHAIGAAGGNLAGTALADLMVGGDDADSIWGFACDDDIRAGGGNDVLRGAAGNDVLRGEAGDDVIDGGPGADRLEGGAGNDRLLGGDGNDTLVGNLGNDALRGGNGHDLLGGGNGNDVIFGDAGNDRLVGGNGNDILDGGDGNDVGRGGAGNDTLRGGNGDDQLYGAGGDDRLFGGPGNDSLFGEGGDDLLVGRGGRDFLVGGPGADTVQYLRLTPAEGGVDTFLDFTLGEDVIDVSRVLSGFDPGGSDPAGFVRLTDGGGNAVLGVDSDGGADGFTDLVLLRGAAGTGLDDLLGAGSLLLA